MASGIVIPAITARYRSFEIWVDPIALQPGEILGIFGKSGSGKTSYLRGIREQFEPTEVHYMSQYDSLLEEITVRQNIELGLLCSGKPAAHFRDWEHAFAPLLRDFEVDRFLHKCPRALSGGQRKRTEIVRCLMMDPKILLLDEPFNGIGHLFESVTTKYILERGIQSNSATIIVSHDFDLLCKFSKRVLLVDDEGIIGFIPTQNPAWQPENIRTAWTLGVENVLPLPLARTWNRHTAADPGHQENAFLSFWGWHAEWQPAGKEPTGLVFQLKRHDLLNERTFMLHGTLYTQVQVRLENGTPLLLIAKGTIDPEDKTPTLHIGTWAVLENNSRK